MSTLSLVASLRSTAVCRCTVTVESCCKFLRHFVEFERFSFKFSQTHKMQNELLMPLKTQVVFIVKLIDLFDVGGTLVENFDSFVGIHSKITLQKNFVFSNSAKSKFFQAMRIKCCWLRTKSICCRKARKTLASEVGCANTSN